MEVDYTSDYVWVHYTLQPLRHYDNCHIGIDGWWTCEPQENYYMEWDEQNNVYRATILQKLGYYNYRLFIADYDGTTHPLPEEGSFYQTENRYQLLVYYRGNGERSWRLVGISLISN